MSGLAQFYHTLEPLLKLPNQLIPFQTKINSFIFDFKTHTDYKSTKNILIENHLSPIYQSIK